MVSFYNKPVPLLVLSTLTIIGETMYPVVLRLLIWIASRCSHGHDR
jgi:Trk-type K+ transport system membrane component